MSLRTRILLLVLLAILAPAAALAFYLFAQRDQEIDKARRGLGTLATYAVENLDDKVSGTVQLLHGLSRAPDLDTTVRAACSDFLAEVLARYPQYTGLLTILPAGDLHCDSLRTGRALNVSQRAYFRQASATLRPAFEVVFGGLTGIAVLQVAYPVVDGSGQLKYVLLASLNLSGFARSFVSGGQFREIQMLLWSRDGMLMVHEPDESAAKLAGRKLADSELFRYAQAGAMGDTAELAGPGGRTAIWALGVLSETQGNGLRITVGVPRKVLVEAADRGLKQALALLVGASLLALVGALLIAELGIRRHAARIMNVAARVGGGDLDARIGAPYPRGEIGELMNVFDRTIEAVRLQRAALEESGRNLRRSNRMLRVLSGINALIVRERDRDVLFREACRIVIQDGGFAKAWIGLVDGAGQKVKLVAAEGLTAEHRARIEDRFYLTGDALMAGTLATRAIAENRVLCANDTAKDPGLRHGQDLAKGGTRSLAVLPLAVAGEVAGLLVLYSDEAGIFDAAEVALLGELAGDISFALDHIEKSERLEYLARYDPITGLANSVLFHERLGANIAAAERISGKVAVFALDIERFKTINDTLGREAGDELLRQFAERLVRAAGHADRFARVSADHFAAMTTEVQTEGEAARLAERWLAERVNAPFSIGGSELRISVKAGIALFPDDGADAATLFRNAEAALKKAKAGGDRFLFYTQKMTERIAESLSLENRLRKALEQDQFVLHYQPKFNIETRAITGLEALIRWQSPELGLVPPAQFIPFLEETGLILPVGGWALQRAVADRQQWVEAGLKPPRVAVNVSAIQLRQRDFVDVVKKSISRGASSGIDLEITESVLMEDIEANIGKLREIHRLGIQIAMDDFGTGYSSLAYLAKLPVQGLKIDRSFVITMLDDPDTMTLVSTMISLAHSLRLKVVAEGVDSEQQARMLRLLRCDELQGFLLCHPLAPQAILERLRAAAAPIPASAG